jgi:hypothetical protein
MRTARPQSPYVPTNLAHPGRSASTTPRRRSNHGEQSRRCATPLTRGARTHVSPKLDQLRRTSNDEDVCMARSRWRARVRGDRRVRRQWGDDHLSRRPRRRSQPRRAPRPRARSTGHFSRRGYALARCDHAAARRNCAARRVRLADRRGSATHQWDMDDAVLPRWYGSAHDRRHREGRFPARDRQCHCGGRTRGCP